MLCEPPRVTFWHSAQIRLRPSSANDLPASRSSPATRNSAMRCWTGRRAHSTMPRDDRPLLSTSRSRVQTTLGTGMVRRDQPCRVRACHDVHTWVNFESKAASPST